jgi:hypothetical protein
MQARFMSIFDSISVGYKIEWPPLLLRWLAKAQREQRVHDTQPVEFYCKRMVEAARVEPVAWTANPLPVRIYFFQDHIGTTEHELRELVGDAESNWQAGNAIKAGNTVHERSLYRSSYYTPQHLSEMERPCHYHVMKHHAKKGEDILRESSNVGCRHA